MFRHPTEVTCPDFRKIKSWFVLLVLPVLAPLPTLLRFTSSWPPMLDRRCLAAGALARYAFSDWLPATSFPQSCRVHNSKLNLGVPQIFYRSILYIYTYMMCSTKPKWSKNNQKKKWSKKWKKNDTISLLNVGLKDLKSKFGTLEEIFKLFPEMRELGRISTSKKHGHSRTIVLSLFSLNTGSEWLQK